MGNANWERLAHIPRLLLAWLPMTTPGQMKGYCWRIVSPLRKSQKSADSSSKTIKICLFHHRFLTCFEFASSIMQAAHQQALTTAGVEDTPEKLMNFLRWRTLRVGSPLRQIAQNKEAGPILLSAAHAAEALQLLLSACASGQNLAQADPFQMAADLRAARESLVYSLANLDIMLGLIDQVENL